MLIDAVKNQKTFPGAGDVDDCWVVATWMGVKAIRPEIAVGSVTWYRGAAGDPDDGVSDGGSTDEILRMCARVWPDVRTVDMRGKAWDWLVTRLKANVRPASIAVKSGAMPSAYRFGFNGAHQILIWWEDGKMWMANPLAPEGAKPMHVDPTAIKLAAYALTGNRTLLGVLLPTRAEALATWKRYDQRQMDAAIKAAVADYASKAVADAAEDKAIRAVIEGQLALLTD